MTFKQYWNAQLERLQKEKKNAPFLIKVLKEECDKSFSAGKDDGASDEKTTG